MNYTKLTAIAALATTILAGSMTAAINDQNRLPHHGLDPVIIELLQRAETGTLPDQFVVEKKNGLKKRTKSKRRPMLSWVKIWPASLLICILPEMKPTDQVRIFNT